MAGFSEETRGKWFSDRSTQMIYGDMGDGLVYFLVNEQNGHLVRIRDKKQIELMRRWFGVNVTGEQIEWLINSSGLRYFDSVEEYIRIIDTEFEEFVK